MLRMRGLKGKGVDEQVYEMMVGGVAGLLENRSRNEVATKINITGSLKNPKTSRWEIVSGLVRNAFFKAMFPGFEKRHAEQ